METVLSRVWRLFLGVAVAGALGVGAYEATAATRSTEAQCMKCANQQECVDCCIREGFSSGGCEGGACYCIL